MNITEFQAGQIITRLEAIQKELDHLSTRTVWRMDNLEERVENLEVRTASRGWIYQAMEKGLWAVAGAVAIALMKVVG